MKEEKVLEAIKQLRELENKRKSKRKFDQTLDLIVNLKNFDVKREGFNIFIQLPHKIKEKKVAGFLEKESNLVDVIKKSDFEKYKDKKDIKKLVKNYDNFIANAKLMPVIATTFGRILGPAGKMPSPHLGILLNEDEKNVKEVLEKINSSVRIITKEPSIKVGVGKESMSDEDLVKNTIACYNKILENLKKGPENVKNVKIKFTMSKPVNVELK